MGRILALLTQVMWFPFRKLVRFNSVLTQVFSLALTAGSVSYNAYAEMPIPATSPDTSHHKSFYELYERKITDRDIEAALMDEGRRISEAFQTPKGMEHSVRFWLRIYTQYSSHQVVVFDDEHPQLAFEILDFTELSKTARNRVVYEILRDRKIRAAMAIHGRSLFCPRRASEARVPRCDQSEPRSGAATESADRWRPILG